MDVHALDAFLRRAKLATYASQGDDASVTPLLPDSRQLEYTEGDWLYRDIYVGLTRFSGQEIVYFQGTAIWSMVYTGGVSEQVEDWRGVYAVLREALNARLDQLPLRGPSHYTREGWSYCCTLQGSLQEFQGDEQMTHGGQQVYSLRLCGGVIR